MSNDSRQPIANHRAGMGKILAVVGVGLFILACASRFTSFRFSQIFAVESTPTQAKSDAEKTSLQEMESRLKALEASTQALTEEQAKTARLEAEKQQLQNALAEKPTVVYQEKVVYREVAPQKTSVVERASAKEKPDDTDAEVVHRGDPAEKVRRVFGRPEAVNDWGSFEVWDYPGRKHVTMRDGVVSAWDGMPVEP